MLYFSSVPDPYAILTPGVLAVLRSDDAVYHVLGFVVLGVLVSRVAAVVASGLTGGVVWRAVLLCVGYGVLDELHQIPIPGRAFNVVDILCDALGAVIGVGLAVLVARWRRRG
jgi:VanZ family protein